MAAPLLAAIPALLGKAAAVAAKGAAAAAKGAAAAAKASAKAAASAAKASAKGAAKAGQGMGRGLGNLGKGLRPKLKTTKLKSFGKKKLKSKVKDKFKEKLKNKVREKSKKKLGRREREEEENTQNKKGKKISKKSEIDSFNEEQEEGSVEIKSTEKTGIPEQEDTTSLTKPQPVVEKIKPADSKLPPIQQIKINVTNIHQFLIAQNKKREAEKRVNARNAQKEGSESQFGAEERKLEFSPFGGSKIEDKVPIPTGGNIFQKLFEFIGIVLLGIFVNALPGLIEKVKGIIDSIVNFLAPIASGFNLVKDFFTGEVDRKGSDADKKKVDDALKGFEEDGGLIDQMAEKLGPLGGVVKMLKPVIGMFRKQAGGKKIVKAKKGGKEGFLNQETGKFTPKQWTSAEREEYEKTRNSSGDGGGSGGDGGGSGGDGDSGGKKELVMEEGDFSGNVTITSKMGMRGLALSPGMHMGIDIAGPLGTPLIAFTDGKVTATGWQSGYGNYVAWVDKFKIEHFYAHMRSSALVKAGQQVKKGTKLGEMGSTGRSSGPHLHWEVSTVPGDTGMPKSAVLSRFDPLSKYPYTAPFGGAVEKGSGGDGKGGGSSIIEKISNVPSENVSNNIIIQPYETIQTQIVYV